MRSHKTIVVTAEPERAVDQLLVDAWVLAPGEEVPDDTAPRALDSFVATKFEDVVGFDVGRVERPSDAGGLRLAWWVALGVRGGAAFDARGDRGARRDALRVASAEAGMIALSLALLLAHGDPDVARERTGSPVRGAVAGAVIGTIAGGLGAPVALVVGLLGLQAMSGCDAEECEGFAGMMIFGAVPALLTGAVVGGVVGATTGFAVVASGNDDE